MTIRPSARQFRVYYVAISYIPRPDRIEILHCRHELFLETGLNLAPEHYLGNARGISRQLYRVDRIDFRSLLTSCRRELGQ